MSEWQPIETAPKGRTVLAWCPFRDALTGNMTGTLAIAWWANEEIKWRTEFGKRIAPTHWMPLPAPPKDAA